MANKQMKTLTIDDTTYDVKDATALPLDGSETMTGTLIMQKVDNGQGEFYKNHNETKDLGTVIVDKDVNGNSARVGAIALTQKVFAAFSSDSNNMKELFGEHNIATMRASVGAYIRSYSSLTQIGLTVGSETIQSIIAAMPADSQLLYYVTSDNNTSIYPSSYGTMLIYKKTNLRTILLFLTTSNLLYTGHYYLSGDTEIWSGWERVIKGADVCNPNLLYNGNFQVWQRGTVFNTSNVADYTADGWMRKTSNMIVQKTDYGLRLSCGTTATSLSITQPIDDFVNKIYSKQITLSCKIRSVSGTWRCALVVGTTNATTFDAALASTTITEAGDYSFTTTITTDLSSYKYVGVSFYSIDSATTNSIEIRSCKLEYGNLATAHTPKAYYEDLLECQRYYYKPAKNQYSIYNGYITTESTQIGFGVQFPVVMRTVPNIGMPSVVVRTINGYSPLSPNTSNKATPKSIFIRNTEPSNNMWLVMTAADGGTWADVSLTNTLCNIAIDSTLEFSAEIR